MGFGDDLVDKYEFVGKRVKDGIEHHEHIAKWLSKMSSLTKDFSKGCASLAKTKGFTEPSDEYVFLAW